jgi:Domain of unknown function (DUF1905)
VTEADPFRLTFAGELWYWRGPSPYHFVAVPPDGSAKLKAMSSDVSYGWGMIPVWVRIGETIFDTSLWPKDGHYIVPIRDVVRVAERLDLGDTVDVELGIRV